MRLRTDRKVSRSGTRVPVSEVLLVLIVVLLPDVCSQVHAWQIVEDEGPAGDGPVLVKRQAEDHDEANQLSRSDKFDDGLGACSRVGDVCGSDGRTYMSECDLAFASQAYELAVVVLHTGRCSLEDFRNAEQFGPTTPALRHLRTLKKLASLRWAPHHSLVQVAERPPPPNLRHAPTQLHPRSSSDPKYRQLLERGPGSSRFNYCWNTKFRTIGECSRTIECLPPAPDYMKQSSPAQASFSVSRDPDPHKYSYSVFHNTPGRASSQRNTIDPFQILNSYPNSGATRSTASGYHVSPREGSISALDDGVTQLPKYLPTGCAYVYKESLYIGECCLPADPRMLNATAQKNVKNIFSSKRQYANPNSVSEDSRLWGAAAQLESESSLTPEIVLYAAGDHEGSLDRSHVMSRPIYDERSDKDVLHSNPSRDVGQTPSQSGSGSQGEFRGSWEYLKDWPPPIPTHPPSLTDKPWWVSHPTLPPQRTTEPPTPSWDPWGTTPTAPTTANPWWPPPSTTPPSPTVASTWRPRQTTPSPPTSSWWLPPSVHPFPWWTPGFPSTTSTTTTTEAPTPAHQFQPVNRGTFQAACSPGYSSSFRTRNPSVRKSDNSVPETLQADKDDNAFTGINRIKYHGYGSSSPSYRKIWTNGYRSEHPHGVFGRRMMYDVSDPKIMYPSNTYYDKSNAKNRVTENIAPGENEVSETAQEFSENDFKVVGGRPSSPHSYPWLAALFNGPKQFCGGSLIDSTHVLTAAHCVATLTSVDLARLRIVLGAHDIKHPEATAQTFTAKKVVRHKDYDPVRLMNDIAMITLNEPAVLTSHVHPICLNSNPTSLVQEVGTVAGWGSLFEGGPQQGKLWEVQLVIWDNNSCRAKYGPAAPGGIVPSYLCAGRGGKDSCSGDSGGPIIKKVNGVWTQVGLVSWGIGCGKGQYPGVYSRMTHFLPWITKVINKF